MRISDWTADVCSSDLVALRTGRRASTARAFLKPAMKRPNLHVVTGAHTHRVLMQGRRATGVVYQVGAGMREAQAGREVIVAAGAIGSPQILELSGIGQGARLQQLGVPVVHALAGVGENLRSEEHTSELQSPIRHSYAVFCL